MARAATELDRITASEAPRRAGEGPLPKLLLTLATLIVAGLVAWASTGGKKWQGLALISVMSAAGLAAWLNVTHRFIDFATWLMTLVAPIALDVEVWHRFGSNPIVSGWPAHYTLAIRDLLIYFLYAAWALEVLLRRPAALYELRWVLRWPVVLLAAGVASFAMSPDAMSSAIEWSRVVHFVLLFAYLAKRVDRRDLLQWMIVAIALHVWVEVGFSSLQYAMGSSLGLEFLGEREAVKTFDTPDGANARAGGLMGHPNNLALYFVLTGPIVLAQILKQRQALPWRAFWAATFVALNFGLLLTFSRAGWLCAAATALLVFHWFQRRAGRPRIVSIGLPILVGVVAFVMLFALWDDFRNRLLAPDYGSTTTRWQQFSTALNVIAHRWWAGTGLGAYVEGAYQFNAGEGSYRNLLYRVHNGSLLVTAEIGLLGGIAYHAWLWLVMKRGWALLALRDHELWPIVVGCFTGLLGWIVKSMYNVHTPFADISLWHVAALLFAVGNCVRRETASR